MVRIRIIFGARDNSIIEKFSTPTNCKSGPVVVKQDTINNKASSNKIPNMDNTIVSVASETINNMKKTELAKGQARCKATPAEYVLLRVHFN